MTHFLIANRLAGGQSESRRKESYEAFDVMRSRVGIFADIVSDHETEIKSGRGMLVVEGDAQEFEAKRRELSPVLIVEPKMHRGPAVFYPTNAANVLGVAEAGFGASVVLTVLCAGIPMAKAAATMFLVSRRGAFTSAAQGQTDATGVVSLSYDRNVWVPLGVVVNPQAEAWSGWLSVNRQEVTLSLPPLPHTGPLGWWHQSLGVRGYSERQGDGIRIGVADTGVGPHPYLTHAQSAGAFLGGRHIVSPGAETDVAHHGTHVAGIIGARPTAGSGHFAGIAPGAELIVARVYPGGGALMHEEGVTSNGDVANAIDELSNTHSADIINLSLGGYQPSEIEADALMAAVERGSLIMCSAGNTYGPPVLYPAAYPQAVAVSAVGLLGGTPFNSLDSLSLPTQPDRYGLAGFYMANFNSVGSKINSTGPGVGIISTVPGRNGASYVALSGTSMASPAVAAALATLLSKDTLYRQMERGLQRSYRAWTVLVQTARSLGLYPQYQGYGYPTAWPQ